MLVDKLAQQFDRRLGSVLFDGWHVHVVDENDAFLVALCPVELLALLDELGLDVCLRAAAVSLGREVEHDWQKLQLLFVFVDEVLNDHRLASACASSHENWFAHLSHQA